MFSYLVGSPGAEAFVATHYCSIYLIVVWFLFIPSTASFAKDETILLAIYCSLQFGTICVNHRVIPICSQPLLTHIPCYLFFYLHFIQTIVVVAPAFDFVSDSYLYPFPA